MKPFIYSTLTFVSLNCFAVPTLQITMKDGDTMTSNVLSAAVTNRGVEIYGYDKVYTCYSTPEFLQASNISGLDLMREMNNSKSDLIVEFAPSKDASTFVIQKLRSASKP